MDSFHAILLALLQGFTEYFERHGKGDAQVALSDYRARFGEKGLFENTVYEGIPALLTGLAKSARLSPKKTLQVSNAINQSCRRLFA